MRTFTAAFGWMTRICSPCCSTSGQGAEADRRVFEAPLLEATPLREGKRAWVRFPQTQGVINCARFYELGLRDW